jgi:amino acid transporter
MRSLAQLAGVGALGVFIDLGALVSMFACTLACLTAAARVMLRMGQNGIVHRSFGVAHSKNATPHLAVLSIGVAMLLPVAYLAGRGFDSRDIYGWMGSLSVYGFITAYSLAAISLPIYLKRIGQLSAGTLALSIAATLAMVLALAGTLYPVPDRPYNWLPYLYLVYLACGTVWYLMSARRRTVTA